MMTRTSCSTIAVVVTALFTASATTVRPLPAAKLELTPEMTEELAQTVACKSSVESIDARYREMEPVNWEYANVSCAPYADDQGRIVGRNYYCKRNPPDTRWACEESLSTVHATIHSKPILIGFHNSTPERAIDVVAYLLQSPVIGEVVPWEWASSRLSVHEGESIDGKFVSVRGEMEDNLYYYFRLVRESSGKESSFRVDELYRCRGDGGCTELTATK